MLIKFDCISASAARRASADSDLDEDETEEAEDVLAQPEQQAVAEPLKAPKEETKEEAVESDEPEKGEEPEPPRWHTWLVYATSFVSLCVVIAVCIVVNIRITSGLHAHFEKSPLSSFRNVDTSVRSMRFFKNGATFLCASSSALNTACRNSIASHLCCILSIFRSSCA